MSTNDGLNARLDALAAHYRTELDLQRGLEQLRDESHGLIEECGELASAEHAIPESENGVSVPTGGRVGRTVVAHGPAGLDSTESMITMLEGTLVASDVLQVDLSKLEGTPTGKAFVIFKRQDLNAASLTVSATRTAMAFLLVTLAGVVASTSVAVLAIFLEIQSLATLLSTTITLASAIAGGSYLLGRTSR